jgi:hypothetical protein
MRYKNMLNLRPAKTIQNAQILKHRLRPALTCFGALVQVAPGVGNVPVAPVHFRAPSVGAAPAWLAHAAAAHWVLPSKHPTNPILFDLKSRRIFAG